MQVQAHQVLGPGNAKYLEQGTRGMADALTLVSNVIKMVGPRPGDTEAIAIAASQNDPDQGVLTGKNRDA